MLSVIVLDVDHMHWAWWWFFLPLLKSHFKLNWTYCIVEQGACRVIEFDNVSIISLYMIMSVVYIVSPRALEVYMIFAHLLWTYLYQRTVSSVICKFELLSLVWDSFRWYLFLSFTFNIWWFEMVLVFDDAVLCFAAFHLWLSNTSFLQVFGERNKCPVREFLFCVILLTFDVLVHVFCFRVSVTESYLFRFMDDICCLARCPNVSCFC